MKRTAGTPPAAWLVAAALLTTAGGSAAGEATALRLPKDDKLVVQGLASFDQAGLHNAPMAYPAPNLAGALVAVLTHGLIAQAQKDKEKSQLQERADKVLAPYQSVLGTLNQRSLLQQAAASQRRKPVAAIEAGDEPSDGSWVELQPVLSMTQDERAFVLDAVVSVPQRVDGQPRQLLVRVVSTPVAGDDVRAQWLRDDGAALKTTVASLMAETVEWGVSEAAWSEDTGQAPQRTYRYMEGAFERMERASLIAQQCGRVVLRTLRGGVLSAPPRPADTANCTPPSATPAAGSNSTDGAAAPAAVAG